MRPTHETPSARARIVAGGLALLTALGPIGCAVGPAYRRTEPSAPAAWSRLHETAGASTSAGAVGDLSQWWRGLNDPTLTELMEEALRASPDLRAAQARLRQARARSSMAGAERFPTVTASASAGRNGSGNDKLGSSSNQFSAGFDASWEVDLFGGVRRGVEAAVADEESSQASLDGARVSLVAEVARDYVEVRALQLRLAIARNNLDSQSETLQLTEWRAQAGLVNAQDVEQARSNREQTLAQLPALEIGLAEAEHALDVLLGKAPGSLHARLAGGAELPAMPAEIAVGIPADTLRQRPDVRAAERTLAAETARVGVAQAARYPTLKLSGSIGVEAVTGAALGNGSGTFYSLLAGLTAPIFDAGKLRSQVEAQDAVREQAQVAYQRAVLTALQDVENALVSLARNGERAEALARALAAARNAAQLAQQRYRAGLIDFQSVLDTQRSVLSVEDSLATTRSDGVLALIQLYKALGGGWSPPAQPGLADKEAP